MTDHAPLSPLARKCAPFLFSLGHFLNDFYGNFLPVLLPIIMPRLGLSLTLSGLLVMVMSITSNILQPAIGYLMDHRNIARLLVPVIPFGALCITGIGFVESKAMLFILIALTGLSISAYHPLGSTFTVRLTDDTHQGSAASYFIAGGNLGFAISPILLVFFLSAYSLTDLPWLTIPAFLFAAVCAVLRLSSLSTCTNAKVPVRFCSLFRNKSILLLNLSMGLRCVTHVSLSTFLPLLLVEAGYSSIASGSMLTLFLAGCTVGGLVGGYLGDRIAHKKIIACSLLLAIFPTVYFYQHASTEPLSCLALFLAGALVLAPQPSSLVWAQKALPGGEATAGGMMMGFSFGLGSLGNAVVAAAGDHIGLPSALLFSALTLPLAGITAILAPFPTKGHL